MKLIPNIVYEAHQFDGNVPHKNYLEGSSLYRWMQEETPWRGFEVRRVLVDIVDEEDGSVLLVGQSRVFIETDDGRYDARRWTELKAGDVVYLQDYKKRRLLVMSEMEFKFNYSVIKEVS